MLPPAQRAAAALGRVAVLTIATLSASIAACGPSASSDIPRWSCPAGWVPYAHGGCGPAVLLCATGGGAAAGACANVDLSRGTNVTDADGGQGTTFYRAPDGAIAGGWPTPGAPGGPPTRDWIPDGGADPPWRTGWMPDAGVAVCPMGWTRTMDGACDPVIRTDCASGTAALPGGMCTHTGVADCAPGEYVDPGAEAVGSTVVRVRSGADPVGADGSVARPYATIGAGLVAAGAGGWVLVAAGTYTESIEIDRGAHIVGVCPARTIVVGPAGAPVVAAIGDADVRGLTARGGLLGVSASGAVRATVRNVVVERALGIGLLADGTRAMLEATDVRVVDTQVFDGTAPGRGFQIQDGGAMTLRRTEFVGNHEVGGWVTGRGSRLTMEDSIVRDTQRDRNLMWGDGVYVSGGGVATLLRVVARHNRRSGLTVEGAGSQAHVDGFVVDDTLPLGDDSAGVGINVGEGGSLDGTGVIASHNWQAGVSVRGPRAQATLTASVFRDNLVNRSGRGAGAAVVLAGRLTLSNVLVLSNDAAGLVAAGDGSSLQVRDSVVRDTRPMGSMTEGFGLRCEAGAILQAQRVLLDGNALFGAAAVGIGARLEVTESVIRDTLGTGMDYAAGVHATQGGSATMRRVLVESNVCLGVESTGGDVTIEDSWIRGHASIGGRCGMGVVARGAGTVTADRLLLSGNQGVAALVPAVDSRLILRDSVVRDTRPRGDIMGHACEASGGGHLELSRVLLTNNVQAGVMVTGPASTATITDTVVDGTLASERTGLGAALFAGGGAVAYVSHFDARASHLAAIAVGDERTRVTMTDSRIADTVAHGTDVWGRGTHVFLGAQLDLVRALFENNHEIGISAVHARSVITLTDVIVRGVGESSRGMGLGIQAAGGASISGTRVAVAAVRGAAIASVPVTTSSGLMTLGSSISLDDGFVTDVRSSTVQVMDSRAPVAVGPPVAYGLHAANGCSVVATRIVIADGGHGFYNAGTSMTLRHALIRRQLDNAGAYASSVGRMSVVTDDAHFRENARNEIVEQAGLPDAVSIAPPSPVCVTAQCM